MNYLRGAVSAISAPYQYYRDLNPSTLTGAIDVIVIRRPKVSGETEDIQDLSNPPEGETELVCSPFHVRFGKWQVLRPADKKVDVFVNGNPVPFPMKIGDAGEAFFVFETDEDVPDSLVTSPVLAATEPEESNEQPVAGKFGAKEEGPSTPPQGQPESSQEPEFLDLNASPNADVTKQASGVSQTKPKPEDQEANGPILLSHVADASKTSVAATHELEKTGKDDLEDHTFQETVNKAEKEEHGYLRNGMAAVRNVSPSPYLGHGSDEGDKALPDGGRNKVEPPDVRYTDDMVFDMEGYHSHARGRSDRTVRSSDRPSHSNSMDSNRTHTPERTPGPSRSPTPDFSPSSSSSYLGGPVMFPPFRANSEPPPDMEQMTLTLPSRSPPSSSNLRQSGTSDSTASTSTLKVAVSAVTEEYSWEWGNFPQKTPVRASFGAPFPSAKGKGKARMLPSQAEEDELEEWSRRTRTNSRSRLSQMVVNGDAMQEDDSSYGSGGLLTVDRRDPTRFRVFIEGRAIEFELGIVPPDDSTSAHRGGAYLTGEDEVEDARRFDAGTIDFQRFLDDESVVTDENLVLRWAGDKYITRKDGSPLMDALKVWREGTLRSKTAQVSSRPVSPRRSDDTELTEPLPLDRRSDDSSAATRDTPKDSQRPSLDSRKPSSSSWVRWWSRSRLEIESSRPDLRPISSSPPSIRAGGASRPDDILMPVNRVLSAESSPLPSTPESIPEPQDVTPLKEAEAPPASPRKRFAKTLRLTSDQLKSLDLKSGANTVTFSLSATGVAACTAKLFVWDYTDQIVVSDIDGTITKSDALGHVFTMIGRDWTHSGVAKLYTDICRNGYKIMYLTSRAIGQADSTRDYLKGIKQNDYQLPEGPVIMSPDRLMASLHREVIMRKPEVFKMACLRDIQRLFGPYTKHPFYAGFGNRITDALSYRSVNIPSSRIFTIDSTGEVKMELLELAGYKSSYIHMTDLVDQMFPPINRKWQSDYTDFNYWKAPVQDFPLPDFSPPSPALSARSDTSTQSALTRLRNFSLVGSRQSNNMKQFSVSSEHVSRQNTGDSRRDAHLRQMSSLERLSSTLVSLTQSSSSTAASPRSTTPTYVDSGSDEEEEYDDELEKGRHRRRRTRSISSMPGSLPGSTGSDDEMQFEVDGEGSGDEEYPFEGAEPPEDTFDEDLFAAGEMKDVPFL